MMSGSYDRPGHALSWLLQDLKQAYNRKTIFLSCDGVNGACTCGGQYNALRGFTHLPRCIIQRFSLIHYFDRLLRRDHYDMLGKLTANEREQQQRYWYFLWDRQFEHAGICEACGQGRFSYSDPIWGICSNCNYSYVRRHGG